jgi:predicted GH43/DUF377 family glycosyl hydrolase
MEGQTMKRKTFITIAGIILIFELATLVTLMFSVRPSTAQAIWTDTFADTTGISSSSNVTQVIDTVGGPLGASFTPYSSNPLLTIESCDPWDAQGNLLKKVPGAVHPDVLYFPDGIDGYKFWMFFTPFGQIPPGGSGTPDWYWERPTLVRSNDGINWEKTNDYINPLIVPGVSGWDSAFLADPDVVYAPGRGPSGESWFLYYLGFPGQQIGVALSSDGKHFTKYTGNPITPPPTYRPTVIYDETTGVFHMWYNWTHTMVGYATSTDGINWTPYNPDNPGQWGYIVYEGTPGAFDAYGVHHMDVIYYQGQYWMYYLGMPTSTWWGGLIIGLATSPDGIHWTQYPNPILTPEETWAFTGGFTAHLQSLYRPSVVIVNDTMHMYYGGTDSYVASGSGASDNWELGLALSTTTAPDGHVELELGFNPAEYTPISDAIAWYHMNEGNPPPPGYPGEYNAKDPTLAWYHFNEGAGTTAGDSGNNNDGTLNLPTWTTGLYGNGLYFDGINDWVIVPNSAVLNPTEAITIESWVNPSIEKGGYVAIKMTHGTDNYSYGLKIESVETGYATIWAFIVSPSGTLYWAKGAPRVPLGTWTHIAMTYEMNPTGSTHSFI